MILHKSNNKTPQAKEFTFLIYVQIKENIKSEIQ